MTRRLLFDISTSMRWFGPPVGIVRVERELAKWAMDNNPDCHFVFFDADLQMYREIHRDHLLAVLEGLITVDTTGMRDPSRSRPRKTERVPRSLLKPFLWLTQFRRMALRTFGRMLLRSRSANTRQIITFIQTFIAGKKYRQFLIASHGRQRVLVGLDALASNLIHLEAGDWILFAGANWGHSNVGYIAEQKKHMPIDLVTLCYDIIPLLYPQFFKPHDVQMLWRHFDAAFAVSSLILVTSNIVARDVHQYCTEKGISVGPIRQIPLGFDLPKDGKAGAVPAQAQRYLRYIMFVSTIEPRKGHRLVQRVWSRLLQEGIPQRFDVGLLLVGRSGWLVDDLLETLSTGDRVTVLNDVDDCDLAALYNTAEFCIYPSEYEGYGLPVVEALARGKAVLASNIGFVPELEADLLQRLTPNDEQAWYEAIREWLAHPPNITGARQFHHPTWGQAAAQTFATIYEGGRVLSMDQTSETPRGG